ncbi:OLC1v1007462C1 [Oldenlandia corymbosa var. corymbosa]|uniref:OLC1v1007462C1 n=1 Tax=Oldenlandia corymbosa var. corymbosa TaxID=529605 RepID=A0AAV1DJC1_OLDCO|nr:OLC1v1007462C1 [Oldenlandia corymbosa var. corymbosa]
MLFSSQKKPGYEQYWLATSFIIPIFKLLKVLDLEQIHLGDEFPSEIEILLQLRYLSIRGGMEAIPASIGKLSNLETLIVYLERVHLNVSFPRTLWNLKKLKWLFINSGGGILPVENLEDSPILQELESLSCAVMYSHAIMEKHLRKFPNIRRLKCDLSRLFAQNQNLNEIVVPGFLEKLESLHLLLSDLTLMKQKRHATFDFSLPASLKKLTLSRFGLPWEKISAIGKELNQLEVLKLLDSCFVGDTWEMQYDEFPNLRYLKLSRLDHVNWTADASFECLEKLVLESCSNLVDIPGCLGSVTKLKTIDVISCSDGLESVVQEIERQQKEDWGNKSFKVRSC